MQLSRRATIQQEKPMHIRSGFVKWLSVSAISLVAFAAHAQNTTMSIISEPGDYIGQGQSLTFNTVVVTSSFGNSVVGVEAYSPAHTYYLTFSVREGQLLPGVYEFAPGVAGPALSVAGDSRGCSGATGRFEIKAAQFDANGRAERFRADFEYHCGSLAAPGLFGEISVIGPPPAPVAFGFTIDEQVGLNRITGEVSMSGTLTCSAETSALVYLLLSQPTKHVHLTTAFAVINTPCSPTPRRWATTVPTDASERPKLNFRPGAANIYKNVFVADPNYNTDRFESGDQVVRIAIDNHQQ
jgi:hypothetical protein